jgi:riboflavin synthase
LAVSGPCLPITAFRPGNVSAFVMPETLRKTTLGSLKPGQKVNLERAMTLNGRLGGHLVSGHIDEMVIVQERKPEGAAILLSLGAPGHLLRYIVPKGSVALDGVSLTVIEVGPASFSVGLIPHTGLETTLGSKEIGASVNLEVDLIGKYVEKMLQNRVSERADQSKKLTMERLAEKGYL